MAREEGNMQRRPWSTPLLSFDGELRDFVQEGMKPTAIAGEPGDPGLKPSNE
jgi:hypothetical protein